MLSIPTYCPVCGEKLIIEGTTSKVLRCINPKCSGQFSTHIIHAVGKSGFDIEELSKKTVEKLIEYGWIQNLADIFTLKNHKEEWLSKDGFGEKSVNQILEKIDEARNTELWRVLVAAGIPNVEKTTAKEIEKIFPTWEKFSEAVKTYDFTEISGFGEKMNKSIKDFDYSEIESVIPYLTFKSSSIGGLTGITFCITGTLSRKRDDIVKDIEDLGGQVSGSVTKNTDYLVCNSPSGSSKYKKATELGVKVITEEELKEIMK